MLGGALFGEAYPGGEPAVGATPSAPARVPDARARRRPFPALRVLAAAQAPAPPAYPPQTRTTARRLVWPAGRAAVVPVPTAAALVDARPRRALRLPAVLARGGRAEVPLVQAAPVAPAYPLQPRTLARRLAAAGRSSTAAPVPVQAAPVAPAVVVDVVRARIRRALALRSASSSPPVEQPTPPRTGTRRRPAAAGRRLGRGAAPVVEQLRAPAAPSGPSPLRRALSVVRGASAGPVPVQEAAPVAPPLAPDARTRVRRLAAVLRGSTAAPVPAQEAPPVNPDLVHARPASRARSLYRRRPRVSGPVAPVEAVQQPRRARRLWLPARRATVRGLPTAAAAPPVTPAVPPRAAAPASPLRPRRGRAAAPPAAATPAVAPARVGEPHRKRLLAGLLRRARHAPGWLPPTVSPPTAAPVDRPRGGWWFLRTMRHELDEAKADERVSSRRCGFCGDDTMVQRPDGAWVCSFDGWPDPPLRSRVPVTFVDEPDPDCPQCGELLLVDGGRRVCTFCGWSGPGW